MIYLKRFETHEEYESYMGGGDLNLPNVSICEENIGEVHYTQAQPGWDGRVWCYFDVQDISVPTRVLQVTSNIRSMEVDGEQVSPSTTYQFDSVGEHLIKYELIDNTYVYVSYARRGADDNGQFRPCPIKRCYFPKSVTNLAQTFRGNGYIEYINFPDSGLVNIGNYAFSSCSNLTGDLEIPLLSGYLSPNTFSGTGYSRIVNLGNVTTLGGNGSGGGCFASMRNLIYAEFPESLSAIESHVFYRCPKLSTIVCRAAVPPTISGTPFKESNAISSIYVPDDSVDAYKMAGGWSEKASIIKPLLEYIPNN